MVTKSRIKAFTGPVLLLIVTYIIYFLRYPLWTFFTSVEPIFLMLTASYAVTFLLALCLIKKDSKQSLKTVFKPKNSKNVTFTMLLVLFYYGLLYVINYLLGASFESASFLSLKGFESYTVYILPVASLLYLLFAVFGAFAEEVTYRGYVQTRITAANGPTIGILVATLLFSLQHIHVFQLNWLTTFFQTQFIHVMFFGAFVGILYVKTKQNLWTAVVFHGLSNTLNITLPTITNSTTPAALILADIISITTIILLTTIIYRKHTA